MKSLPINDFFATNGRIREDGRMVHDMYLFEVKQPSESKRPWDYYKLVATLPGDQAFMPLSKSTCPLLQHRLVQDPGAVQQLRGLDPFFRAVAAAIQAWDEDHADGARGRHVHGVMACATGQAHRRVTQLVGRGLDRVHHQRRTVRGLRAAQLREACRQAQRQIGRGHV
ncbi:hypothetical protein G6F61_014072 [Rhizopus arrhizus]|nr:hypothetical protein G6F61_014072 [Rhizopus arrhizus]